MRFVQLLRRHPVLGVFLFAFAVRAGSILLVQQVLGSETFGVGDDATYSFLAEGMAEGRSATWDPYAQELYNSAATFTVPLTVLHLLFGSIEIGGPLLAAFFGAVAAALVTRVLLEVSDSWWPMAGGAAVALFPSQVLWSSLTLKDSAVWAVLAGLAAAVAVANRNRGRALAVSGVAVLLLLLLLAHLRAHTFVVATWAVVIAALFSSRSGSLTRIAGAAVLALGLPWALGMGPAAIPFAFNQDLESRRTANAFGAATAFVPPSQEATQAQLQQELEEEVGELEADLKRGGSAEEEEAIKRRLGEARQRAKDLQTPPEAVRERAQEEIARVQARLEAARSAEEERELQRRLEAAQRRALEAQRRALEAQPPAAPDDEVLSPNLEHLPKGLSVMLFEPYPWQDIRNSRVRLAQLENILWYPVLTLAVVGLVQVVRRRRWRSALMFTILVGGGTLLVYALAEGNFGTAYRHRGEFVWAAITLAVVGAIEASRIRKRGAVAAGNNGDTGAALLEDQDPITEANKASHLAKTESLL